MFFKELTFSKLDNFKLTADQLNEKFNNQVFKSLPDNRCNSIGWVTPFGDDSEVLAHGCGNKIIFCYREDSRTAPKSEIDRRTKLRIDELLDKGDAVTKAEMETIREAITSQLLPNMPVKTTKLMAYIDLERNLLLVNTKTANKADNLIALLRKSIGSLAASMVLVNTRIESRMANWICKPGDYKLPKGLGIPSSTCAQVIDREDKNSGINLKQVDVTDEDICQVIEGRVVSSLGMVLISDADESENSGVEALLHFTISTSSGMSFVLSKLDFIVDEEEQFGPDDKHWLDADMCVMSGAFDKIIPLLIAAFDGEDESGKLTDQPKDKKTVKLALSGNTKD